MVELAIVPARLRSGFFKWRMGTSWSWAKASTSRRNRFPIFSISAGEAIGLAQVAAKSLNLTTNLQVGDVRVEIETIDAGQV